MPTIETIQPKIARGYGKVGRITGQIYNVYRRRPTSSGQVVQSSNLIATVRASFHRYDSRKNVETNVIIKVPLFEAYFDPTTFRIGDVFVEQPGQRYTDASVFTYAYFRPVRFAQSQALLFVHTPFQCTWTRAVSNLARTASGRVPYQGMEKDKEEFLVLNNGSFTFATTGTPAVVYCGLVATHRRGDLPPIDDRLPTDVRRQEWHAYAPFLPGAILLENDILNGPTGDRYYGSTPFSQPVGLQGWQVIGDKMRV